VRGTACGVRWA